MNKDLTVGSPSKVLWQFCLPMFGSILFQQLYNIADSLVAGKLIGENALAAVGLLGCRSLLVLVRTPAELMADSAEYLDIYTLGLPFLQTIAPFYLLLAFKLTSDGLMRGCGMMGRFMATTLSDLFLRVVLAMLFSRWLGVNGIWLSWPVGWFVGTVLSMVFYRTSIYRQAEEKTTL